MSEDFSKNNLEEILKKQQGPLNHTAVQRKMNKNKADISNVEFYGDIITTIINSYEGGCVAVYDSQAQWFSDKQDMLEAIKHKKSTSNILEIDISLEYQLAKEREPLKPFTNGEYILCVDDNGLVYKGQGRYPMTYQTPDNEGIIPEGNDIMFGPGSRVEGQPLHPKTKMPTLPKDTFKTPDEPYDPKGDKTDIRISPPDMSHLHEEHVYSPQIIGEIEPVEKREGPDGYVGPLTKEFLGIYQDNIPDFSTLDFKLNPTSQRDFYIAPDGSKHYGISQVEGDEARAKLGNITTPADDGVYEEVFLARAKKNTGFLKDMRKAISPKHAELNYS